MDYVVYIFWNVDVAGGVKGGGGDGGDVLTALPSGQTPRPSCPGTKSPVCLSSCVLILNAWNVEVKRTTKSPTFCDPGSIGTVTCLIFVVIQEIFEICCFYCPESVRYAQADEIVFWATSTYYIIGMFC